MPGLNYLDNPSCARRAAGWRSDYDGVLAVLDLSGPPCPDDNTDSPWLQKNDVDKRMNGTDRNWMLKIWYISNVLILFDFWICHMKQNERKERWSKLKFNAIYYGSYIWLYMIKLNN